MQAVRIEVLWSSKTARQSSERGTDDLINIGRFFCCCTTTTVLLLLWFESLACNPNGCADRHTKRANWVNCRTLW